MGRVLEVEEQIKSGCGVERPGSLVEVGDDEWCKMVIEFVDVGDDLAAANMIANALSEMQ